MREMFRTIFSAITALFRTAEKGANTLEVYATWAEEESIAFKDQAAIERKARLDKLRTELKAVA